jgi:two-component system sensor histidine kinase RstB
MSRFFIIQLIVLVVLSAVIGQKVLLPLAADWWFPYERDIKRIEKHRGGGVILLLAERFNGIPEGKSDKLLRTLKRQFAYEIDIRLLTDTGLQADQQDTLSRGQITVDTETHTIYKLLDDQRRVLVIENMDIPATHIYSYDDRVIDGTFKLLEQVLSLSPQQQWPMKMREVTKYFAFPLELRAISDITLDPEDLYQLHSGGIVKIDTEQSVELETLPDFIYKKINASHVIVAGPLAPEVWKLQRNAMLSYFSLLGLVVVMPLLLWLLPSWLSARSLLKSIQRFGGGDLTVRAQTVFGSHFNALAKIFNQMALQIQQLLNNNKMLTHAVSHELRTPLTRIEFALELLRSGKSEDRRSKQIKRIKDAAEELKNMLAEMKLYARFDRDKPVIQLQAVDINQWLLQKKDRWDLNRADLVLSITPAPQSLIANIDDFYLTRAMDNLVQNAFKYARQRIHIYARRVSTGYSIVVENDGPAIAEQDQQRVFEPFVRLDKSRTRDSGGIGLGLAIVKQIVDWHGGRVTVNNSPLGGAKFVIHLSR